MTVIHVTPGPSVELRREVAGVKWCFACRKRLRHVAVALADAEPSYYEPIWVVRCAGCGEDHTHFPGCGPV